MCTFTHSIIPDGSESCKVLDYLPTLSKMKYIKVTIDVKHVLICLFSSKYAIRHWILFRRRTSPQSPPICIKYKRLSCGISEHREMWRKNLNKSARRAASGRPPRARILRGNLLRLRRLNWDWLGCCVCAIPAWLVIPIFGIQFPRSRWKFSPSRTSQRREFNFLGRGYSNQLVWVWLRLFLTPGFIIIPPFTGARGDLLDDVSSVTSHTFVFHSFSVVFWCSLLLLFPQLYVHTLLLLLFVIEHLSRACSTRTHRMERMITSHWKTEWYHLQAPPGEKAIVDVLLERWFIRDLEE